MPFRSTIKLYELEDIFFFVILQEIIILKEIIFFFSNVVQRIRYLLSKAFNLTKDCLYGIYHRTLQRRVVALESLCRFRLPDSCRLFRVYEVGHSLQNLTPDYQDCALIKQIYLHRFAKVASLAHEATFVAL